MTTLNYSVGGSAKPSNQTPVVAEVIVSLDTTKSTTPVGAASDIQLAELPQDSILLGGILHITSADTTVTAKLGTSAGATDLQAATAIVTGTIRLATPVAIATATPNGGLFLGSSAALTNTQVDGRLIVAYPNQKSPTT